MSASERNQLQVMENYEKHADWISN
ncbi:hypothetical protein PENANT_c044G01566 [Penicillium antarcticum]|uniref:Uncharacterized protein n=1 Tax=Penicillium antarcticum TaxID=416450 RepID=A0A1V6PS88_9EURO|nr:hypothetical protein PENANT_c044G01566 [Penicillium antarcticum]